VKRPLRPREVDTLAVAPVVVSDLTAPLVLGLQSRRAFRDLLSAHPEVPRRRVGKRTFVAVADFVAFVRGGAGASRTNAPSETALEGADEDEDDGADAILRRAGLRRTTGGAGR
jgi:hypothetical protein